MISAGASLAAVWIATASFRAARVDRLHARRDALQLAFRDAIRLHAAMDRFIQALGATYTKDFDRLRLSAIDELSKIDTHPDTPDTALLGYVEAVRLANDVTSVQVGRSSAVLPRMLYLRSQIDQAADTLNKRRAAIAQEIADAERHPLARLLKAFRRPWRH